MSFDPLTAGMNLVTTVIERIVPDKAKSDELKLKLLEMQQNGELQRLMHETELLKGQMG